ncbi:glycosyltransferase [Sphingomonas sp. KR1UV-12]|uniref:Glycosyltransferase n=1 Tax=Sphingomonas aurea TaxID=3063994 RepID=A0ABT9EPA3_9SPHN|nr:glycosyltransferase [Sphingomonas sp. KR1UV-12]MDP1028788.1 glycosyltransferase [Sphingomonas sp. KR1UV-12]
MTRMMPPADPVPEAPSDRVELAIPPRVAIVHYWLVGMRGGERVLEALCDLFPDADIYTHALAAERLSEKLRRHNIRTSFVGRLPFAARWYKRYLPLMPLAIEALDLTGYDLVLCSESGPAKGAILRPGAVQIVYCHSPMRYIWDGYHAYRARAGRLTRALMPVFAHYLRIWDAASAQRADAIVANSAFVAGRVRRFWRREAVIVHPPVDASTFRPVDQEARGDHYLWCGELVGYKRADLAIAACTALGRKLVVIGDGEEMARLKRHAGAHVTFLGRAPAAVLRDHMARARALLFPGEEDFGLVPVEMQASGRPVVALARGGALETVVDGETGLLYTDDSAAGLADAILAFEASGLEARCTPACLANAARFTPQAFRAGMARVLAEHGIALPAPVATPALPA